jgi:tight adherence protein C
LPVLWLVTGVTFLITALVLSALLFAFLPGEGGAAERLSRLLDNKPSSQPEAFSEKQKLRLTETLSRIGKLRPSAPDRGSRLQLMMIRAGYRSATAVQTIDGVQILLPVILLGTVLLTGVYRYSAFSILLFALILGYVIPEGWLLWRISVRQRRIRQALPDALDLLVICVEVGLGLDQALLRVAQELRIVHPELSEEFQMVNLEMRVGKSRLEALRELARRTGIEEAKSLVAMLIQTERFGTSVAQSLRVHSDDLRTRRRQRAEEMSAKTTVKMVPPLVVFIFPALMVVILGPAVITLLRELGSIGK